MLVETRGGVPIILRVTATAAVKEILLLKNGTQIVTKFLQISNEGAANVRVYFAAADAAADANYLLLTPPASGFSYYEGPAEIGESATLTIWLKSEGADCAVSLVGYQRRG